MSSYGIGYLLGMVIGSGFLLFVIYVILETLIFKRVFNDPVTGKMVAAGVATVLMLFLALGSADPSQVTPRLLATIVAAIPLALYAHRRGLKVRARQSEVAQDFE